MKILDVVNMQVPLRIAVIWGLIEMLILVHAEDNSSGFGWDDNISFEHIMSGSGETPPEEFR